MVIDENHDLISPNAICYDDGNATTTIATALKEKWRNQEMNTYGYIRVSSRDQNEDWQLLAMHSKGIAAAKAKGIRFGRIPKPLPENFHAVYQSWKSGELSGTAAEKACGMPLSTFRYRAEIYENAKLS